MVQAFKRTSRAAVLGALLAAALASAAPAQTTGGETASRAAADVASLDAIIAATYETISGPAGAPRDWDRFRHLFHPDARLIPHAPDAAHGARALTPEDYVARATEAFAENGFFEREIGRTTERFGDIAHVMSAYAATRNADDPEPFVRGVNSFQLLRHDGRWWIMTIFWQAETDAAPIPERYLDAP